MTPLKALIVDDELHARENLAMLLDEFCQEVQVIGQCENVEEARKAISELKPELVFLDIRMPSGIEGLELLEEIDNTDFQVIFATAFKEHAVRAFNANAIHYLLKPIDIEELQEAVGKVVEFRALMEEDASSKEVYKESLKDLKTTILTGESKRITITHAKGIKIVKQDEIVYLEGSGNCTYLHFADGSKFLDTRTLKVYEPILDNSRFYRVHKSYIVNLLFLKEYLHDQGHYVVLENDISLPVARNRVPDFVAAIKSIG